MRVEHMTFNYPTEGDALEAFQLFIFRNFSDLIEFHGDYGTGTDREIKFKIKETGMIFGVKQNQLRIFNSSGQLIYTINISIKGSTYQAVNFDGQIALMSGNTPVLMTVKFDDGSSGILTGTTFIYHEHTYSSVAKDSGLSIGQKTKLGAIYNTQINTVLKNIFSLTGAFTPSYPVYMRVGDELLITAGTSYAIYQQGNKGGF